MSCLLSYERKVRALRERIDFETWAIAQGWDVSRRTPSSDSYWNRKTADAWKGWLARSMPTSVDKERT